MSPEASRIVVHLKRMMGKNILPNDPKGLPGSVPNEDNNMDGNYKQENLIDGGIKNMVTGSGRGPVIGGYNRGVARMGQSSGGNC